MAVHISSALIQSTGIYGLQLLKFSPQHLIQGIPTAKQSEKSLRFFHIKPFLIALGNIPAIDAAIIIILFPTFHQNTNCKTRDYNKTKWKLVKMFKVFLIKIRLQYINKACMSLQWLHHKYFSRTWLVMTHKTVTTSLCGYSNNINSKQRPARLYRGYVWVSIH